MAVIILIRVDDDRSLGRLACQGTTDGFAEGGRGWCTGGSRPLFDHTNLEIGASQITG